MTNTMERTTCSLTNCTTVLRGIAFKGIIVFDCSSVEAPVSITSSHIQIVRMPCELVRVSHGTHNPLRFSKSIHMTNKLLHHWSESMYLARGKRLTGSRICIKENIRLIMRQIRG